MKPFKVAGVQMDIVFADLEANLDKMYTWLQETTASGAELTVFPECTTTGYCFDSLMQAGPVIQPEDGFVTSRVTAMCDEFKTHVVFGYLESEGDRVFNSLAMVGPRGVVGRYRKVHLPYLGIDRFMTAGDRPFEVFDTPLCRIGMNICYDSAFPESARCLSILGADLIVLPTNWPPTSNRTADYIPNARAMENHVYFMAVNRVGTENGFEFIGKSKICHPDGSSLAFADHANEAILYAEIDPEIARQKHRVTIPGAHEVHKMNDRVPSRYSPLVE